MTNLHTILINSSYHAPNAPISLQHDPYPTPEIHPFEETAPSDCLSSAACDCCLCLTCALTGAIFGAGLCYFCSTACPQSLSAFFDPASDISQHITNLACYEDATKLGCWGAATLLAVPTCSSLFAYFGLFTKKMFCDQDGIQCGDSIPLECCDQTFELRPITPKTLLRAAQCRLNDEAIQPPTAAFLL